MTNEEVLRRIKNLQRSIAIRTEYDKRNFEALEIVSGAFLKMEEQPDVEQIIDNLWGDIIATGVSYEVDGDKIITDVGYADEGIEFFIKHLKARLKEHS